MLSRRMQNKPLGMKLDQPDPNGSGGNTDTAELGRKFFSEKKRIGVLNLFKAEDETTQVAILEILQGFSVILRVISSKQKVDTREFNEFCLKIYKLFVETFPWASVPDSVHRVLAHCAEVMAKNGEYALGFFTEEGLEALHKFVRRYRLTHARKCGLEENIHDVFSRLYLQSDPQIRENLRPLSCSLCHGSGHTRRSCALNPKREKIDFLGKDDDLVKSFFY